MKRAARLSEKYGPRDDGAGLTVVRHKPAQVKATDDGMVRFIATTEAIDVDDEVVVAGGVDRDSYFFKNRSCFIDHQYDMANFIGKARAIIPRPTKDSPTAWEVHIRVQKTHPHAEGILSLAREGQIGSSIGFARLEGGKPTEDEVKRYTRKGREPVAVTRRWEWIEQSITALPANVEAQAIPDEAAKMLDDAVCRGVCSRELAVRLGLPARERRTLYPVSLPKRPKIIVRVE